jgi:hypothetical protein
MWVLQIAFVGLVLSLISVFQMAAAILANQTGRSFWRWYLIAQFLPIIAIIILLILWDTDTGVTPKATIAQ